MFGHGYASRDLQLAGRLASGINLSLGQYSRYLLADLLNRAVAVESAYRRHYEATDLDRQETLEDVYRVVGMFLQDVEEARTRGLRARIFDRDHIGALSSESVNGDDSLEDLGGELVSAERAFHGK